MIGYHADEAQAEHPPPAARRAAAHRLLAPGWLRAAWMMPLFCGIGAGIVVLFRWLGRLGPDLGLAR